MLQPPSPWAVAAAGCLSVVVMAVVGVAFVALLAAVLVWTLRALGVI